MSPIKEQNKTLSIDSKQKAVFTPLGASNHSTSEREPHDYYATDPKAAELLLEVEDFSSVIWEPACGEGHLAKVFEQAGHQVRSTDLIYRGYGEKQPLDFLLYDGKLFEKEFSYKRSDKDEGNNSMLYYGFMAAGSLYLIELWARDEIRLSAEQLKQLVLSFSKNQDDNAALE